MWTPKQECHWELARGTDSQAPPDPLGQKLGLGPAIRVLTSLPASSDAGSHLRTTGPKENRFGQKLNPLSDLGSEFLRGRVPADPHAGGLFILRAAGRHRQEADLAPRMASLGPALQRFPPPSGRSPGERGGGGWDMHSAPWTGLSGWVGIAMSRLFMSPPSRFPRAKATAGFPLPSPPKYGAGDPQGGPHLTSPLKSREGLQTDASLQPHKEEVLAGLTGAGRAAWAEPREQSGQPSGRCLCPAWAWGHFREATPVPTHRSPFSLSLVSLLPSAPQLGRQTWGLSQSWLWPSV